MNRYWVNFASFPRHYGHPCWKHMAKTVEEAALEDYFYRDCQTNPELLWNMAQILTSGSASKDIENKNILLKRTVPQIRISLNPLSMGAFGGGTGSYKDLDGSCKDFELIDWQYQRDVGYGYSVQLLIPKLLGCRMDRIIQTLEINGLKTSVLTLEQRLNSSKKPLHTYELMTQDDIPKLIELAKKAFPTQFGYCYKTNYNYYTEDVHISCVRVRYDNVYNSSFHLMYTKWQSWYGPYTYDALCSPFIILPYGFEVARIHSNSSLPVIICPDEETVLYINQNCPSISRICAIISYHSISHTDWTFLYNHPVFLLPGHSKHGFQRTMQLYRALSYQKIKAAFIQRENKLEEIGKDLDTIITSNPSYIGSLDLPRFAQYAKEKFDITPPKGVLPQATPISAWPDRDANANAQLIEGLLLCGEILMIYAYRGTGKSLFALLLAIAFQNCIDVLGGKVSPQKKQKVLLFDGELPQFRIKERMFQILRGLGLDTSSATSINGLAAKDEPKKFNFDIEENYLAFEPDFLAADVIIIDGVFRFFPNSMSSSIEGTNGLANFIAYIRKLGKTLILIDHESKSGRASFGSSAKELQLDACLKLAIGGNGVIHVIPTKIRYGAPMEKFASFKIEVDRNKQAMYFEDVEEAYVKARHTAENTASPTSKRQEIEERRELFRAYIQMYPEMNQKELADLIEKESGSKCKRSTICKLLKELQHEKNAHTQQAQVINRQEPIPDKWD